MDKKENNERKGLEYGNKTMKVLNALGQISGDNFYNSAVNDYKGVDRGLRSDSDDMPLGYNDSQQLDGFNFHLFADTMVLSYHTQATTKDVHKNGKGKFEEEIKSTMQANLAYVKKKYKEITGEELKLTAVGEPEMVFEYMNVHRSWLLAKWRFKVGNLKELDPAERTIEHDKEVDQFPFDGVNDLHESFDLKGWMHKRRDDMEKNL